MERSRGGVHAVVAFSLVLVTSGCWSEGTQRPTHLADGRQAQASTIPFEGVDVPVLITAAQSGQNTARQCQQQRPGTVRVDRVGVDGASSTVVSSDRGWVWACDSTASHRDCGQGFGRMGRHGVVDPRLSVTCRDTDGSPLGFMWIQPLPSAAYVVVEHDGYAEAYPVVDSIPVRVTTDAVDVEASSATVRYGQHTVAGERLRATIRTAQVSD